MCLCLCVCHAECFADMFSMFWSWSFVAMWQLSQETFVVEPDPIFHEAPCSTMMETLETVSRHSFDSWSVPTLSDPQPPSNRVLHEAYMQQVTSFMKGVCKNPANLKKLISKSRGELPETKAGPFDSLGGGTPRTRMRFMASIPFLRGSWSWQMSKKSSTLHCRGKKHGRSKKIIQSNNPKKLKKWLTLFQVCFWEKLSTTPTYAHVHKTWRILELLKKSENYLNLPKTMRFQDLRAFAGVLRVSAFFFAVSCVFFPYSRLRCYTFFSAFFSPSPETRNQPKKYLGFGVKSVDIGQTPKTPIFP